MLAGRLDLDHPPVSMYTQVFPWMISLFMEPPENAMTYYRFIAITLVSKIFQQHFQIPCWISGRSGFSCWGAGADPLGAPTSDGGAFQQKWNRPPMGTWYPWCFSAETYAKTKELGPVEGACAGGAPIWIRSWCWITFWLQFPKRVGACRNWVLPSISGCVFVHVDTCPRHLLLVNAQYNLA